MVKKRLKKGSFIQRVMIAVIAGVICGFILFPIAWLLITSFKSSAEVFRIPPTFWPHEFTFEPYIKTWQGKHLGGASPWGIFVLNSFKVSLPATFLTTLISSLAGYGFARFKFPGWVILLMIILISQMFPGPALLIPISELISAMGLYNTHLALILLYTSFAVPFTTWLSIGNFRSIPEELEYAAMVDGCSRIGSFFRIALPLSRIGLITTAIFAFLMSWSEYPFALILLERNELKTVPVGLGDYVQEFNIAFNEVGAATIVLAIPIFVLFLLAQKYFMKGILGGALKE